MVLAVLHEGFDLRAVAKETCNRIVQMVLLLEFSFGQNLQIQKIGQGFGCPFGVQFFACCRHTLSTEPRYNSPMPRSAQQILDEARQLPAGEFRWLLDELFSQANEQAFAEWEKEYSEPEAGYNERFRARVEDSLADESGDISHLEAMKQFHEAIVRARKLKATA